MISFKHVSFTYPQSEKKTLSDVSFSIDKGEFGIIRGATGSGKSTILELLSCQRRVDSGQIHVGAFELSTIKRRDIPKFRRSIGCVFQDVKLLEEKTIRENIAFALEIQRKYRSSEITKRTDDVIERLDLSEDGTKFPRHVSEGTKQRAALARALVNEPLVLIADGATSHLDSESAAGMISLLTSEHIRGMTILLTVVADPPAELLPKAVQYFRLVDGMIHAH
ncbi:MAG: ATP-binding cassette domain-containing protein [bacterium]